METISNLCITITLLCLTILIFRLSRDVRLQTQGLKKLLEVEKNLLHLLEIQGSTINYIADNQRIMKIDTKQSLDEILHNLTKGVEKSHKKPQARSQEQKEKAREIMKEIWKKRKAAKAGTLATDIEVSKQEDLALTV